MKETPRRRRALSLTISLQTLMVLVALVAIVGYWVHLGRRQADTLAAIAGASGSYAYGSQWMYHVDPPGPDRRWLNDLFGGWVGPDYLENAAMIYVSGEKVDGHLIARIGEFRSLNHLYFGGQAPALTDSDVFHLRGLRELRNLDLSGSHVTAAALAHLQGMSQLQELNLAQLPIGDADLARLSGLTSLRELNLSGSRITAAGLVHLRALKGLEVLRLGQTRVDAVAPLRYLTSLSDLDLSGTPIRNHGLEPIADLAALQRLDLMDTPIADDGLAVIARL